MVQAQNTLRRHLRNRFVLSLTVVALLGAIHVSAQERTKKAEEKELTFPQAVDAAKASYQSGQFGKAMSMLQRAMRLARAALRDKVLAAMPAAPDGFERIEEKNDDDAQANAFVALAINAVPIEQKYRAKDGEGNINVQIRVDSPLVKMMAVAFSTVSLNPNAEIIKYGAHKGLLENGDEGNLKLTIVLFDKHAIMIETNGLSDERLFKLFDQKFVDTIATIVQ